MWRFRLNGATSQRKRHFHSYRCENPRYCFLRLYIKLTFVKLHSLYPQVALLRPTLHCCRADTSRIVSSDLRWDGKMEMAVRSFLFCNMNVTFSITFCSTFRRVIFLLQNVLWNPNRLLVFLIASFSYWSEYCTRGVYVTTCNVLRSYVFRIVYMSVR